MKSLITTLVVCAGVCLAQPQTNGMKDFGTIDFSASLKTIPHRLVSSLPGTCDSTNKETVRLTTDNKVYVCSSTNTWTVESGAGGDASTNTSSTSDSQVVLFSGTGGKTLKASTATGIPKMTSGVLGTAAAGTDFVHPSTNVATGAGLTGGGNLSTNRTISLDVNSLPAKSSPDASTDYIVIYDTTGSAPKKALISSLPTSTGSAVPVKQNGTTVVSSPNAQNWVDGTGITTTVSSSGGAAVIQQALDTTFGASITQVQGGTLTTATTTSTSSTAYVATMTSCITSQAAKTTIKWVAVTTNTTTTPTLNVCTLGAMTIVSRDGQALAAGDIQDGGVYDLYSDGSNWRLMVGGNVGKPPSCDKNDITCWDYVDNFAFDGDPSDGKVGDWQWDVSESTSTGSFVTRAAGGTGYTPGITVNPGNAIAIGKALKYSRPLNEYTNVDLYIYFRSGSMTNFSDMTIGFTDATGSASGAQWIAINGGTTLGMGYNGSGHASSESYTDFSANINHVVHFSTTNAGDSWTITADGHSYTLASGTVSTSQLTCPFFVVHGSGSMTGWIINKVYLKASN